MFGRLLLARLLMKNEARYVVAGVKARDLKLPADACPYVDRSRRDQWLLGWGVRNEAFARWDRPLDEVEATMLKAQPYIDRGHDPANVAPSKLILLQFFAQASTEPDAAYAWFNDTIDIQRARYRRRG